MLTQITEDYYSLLDHANGFDQDIRNSFMDTLADLPVKLKTEYIVNDLVKSRYNNIQFEFDLDFKIGLFAPLQNYRVHPNIEYQNFICSFNGQPHVSRKLLTSTLNKWGWFNRNTCSKNFVYSLEELDGHLTDYCGNSHGLYSKLFYREGNTDFFNEVVTHGPVKFNQDTIYNLETALTSSFVHVVSETMGESYHPWVTEKFLLSVVTRGLFVAYAQPGWHAHLEKYFGFKPYTKIFDYYFDTIVNPVERLVALCSMLAKFANLDPAEWHDLYQLETDTIEHNYDHYFSGSWIKQLQDSTSG
jgi:hypothetical protein